MCPNTPIGLPDNDQINCALTSVASSYSNEMCKTDTDCIATTIVVSPKCVNNLCTGYSVTGGSCQKTSDCEFGNFCNTNAGPAVCIAQTNTGTCITSAEPGVSSCTNDYACVNDVCVPGGQQKGGEACNYEADCASNYCDLTTGKCSYEAPVSAKEPPFVCTQAS